MIGSPIISPIVRTVPCRSCIQAKSTITTAATQAKAMYWR